MTKIDKEYIEKEYEQAIKEYNAALTEDDLETDSIYITKNLVCKFPFLELY